MGADVRTRCRKCLLSQTSQTEVFESVKRLVEGLEEDVRVSEGEYRARLMKCESCDQLLAGMCRLCGCYVELRAAIRTRSCPKARPEWSMYEEKKETES